jgi:hypothetical protein
MAETSPGRDQAGTATGFAAVTGSGKRGKTRGVIAGLVPAISIRMAQRPIIEMAGTSPAMTKWGCHEFCPYYREQAEVFDL